MHSSLCYSSLSYLRLFSTVSHPAFLDEICLRSAGGPNWLEMNCTVSTLARLMAEAARRGTDKGEVRVEERRELWVAEGAR